MHRWPLATLREGGDCCCSNVLVRFYGINVLDVFVTVEGLQMILRGVLGCLRLQPRLHEAAEVAAEVRVRNLAGDRVPGSAARRAVRTALPRPVDPTANRMPKRRRAYSAKLREAAN